MRSVDALHLFIEVCGCDQILALYNNRTLLYNTLIICRNILNAAVNFTNFEIVEYILSLKIVPLTACIGYNAVRNGDFIMIEYLCKNGIQIDNNTIYFAYIHKQYHMKEYLEKKYLTTNE